jgi:hypothetical protein
MAPHTYVLGDTVSVLAQTFGETFAKSLKTKNWKTARSQGVVTRVDDPVHSITVDCGGGSQYIVAYKRSCLKLVKPAPARPVEEAEEEEEPDSEVEVEEEPEEEAAAAAAAATEGDTDPHLEGWTRQDVQNLA